jgi:hypothetical protein
MLMWTALLFFARGQLGVAIGRVKTKAGLRGRNLNRYAANLKHSPCVYQFYDQESSTEPMYDLSCSNILPEDPETSILYLRHGIPSVEEATGNRFQDRYNFTLHEMTAFTFPELVRRIFRQLASAFQDQPVAWFYVEKRRHWRITVLPS